MTEGPSDEPLKLRLLSPHHQDLTFVGDVQQVASLKLAFKNLSLIFENGNGFPVVVEVVARQCRIPFERYGGNVGIGPCQVDGKLAMDCKVLAPGGCTRQPCLRPTPPRADLCIVFANEQLPNESQRAVEQEVQQAWMARSAGEEVAILGRLSSSVSRVQRFVDLKEMLVAAKTKKYPGDWWWIQGKVADQYGVLLWMHMFCYESESLANRHLKIVTRLWKGDKLDHRATGFWPVHEWRVVPVSLDYAKESGFGRKRYRKMLEQELSERTAARNGTCPVCHTEDAPKGQSRGLYAHKCEDCGHLWRIEGAVVPSEDRIAPSKAPKEAKKGKDRKKAKKKSKKGKKKDRK